MEAQGTLVTFLLPSVHRAGSIDLYGSWDNFSAAYPMQKDRQKGHGHWYGCHVFKNVICHGDPSNCQMPQDGPLKMGATYWYYYRRDGNQEFHDPSETSTTSCPLLPGQTVNVIELPVLEHSAFSQPGAEAALTTSPEDRWTTPKHTTTLRKPTVPEPSREWWFSQSFGRLHTAIVEHVLSRYEAGDVSCTARRKTSRRLPGRRLKSAPDAPRSPSSEPPVKPGPDAPKQGSLRRPRLPWRNSNRNVNRPHSSAVSPQFHNPFQRMPDQDSDLLSDFEDDWEYDMDAIADNSASSRPVTWACSFPTLRRLPERRPSSMPRLPADPSSIEQDHTNPAASQTASPPPPEEAPKPERPSLEPLSLPGALHLPLLDADFPSAEVAPSAKQQPIEGMLLSTGAPWTPAASPPTNSIHGYLAGAPPPKQSVVAAPLSPPSMPTPLSPAASPPPPAGPSPPRHVDDPPAPSALSAGMPSRVRDMVASFEKRAPTGSAARRAP